MAVLSADKATVYLTQDEGHDIILTDLDWADVGNDDSHSLQVTGMDSRIFDTDGTTELLSGSAVNVYDQAFDDSGNETAGFADSVIVSGQVNMHASHTFTVTTDYGDGDDGLFESSPGVATLNKVSELSLRSRSKAIDALKMVDKALDKIHMERAKLGAVMSRMDQAIDNLTNVSANTSSARSRIVDADMAAEAGNLTKTQILQQSAMAMIAQASKAQQAVLTLLQG